MILRLLVSKKKKQKRLISASQDLYKFLEHLLTECSLSKQGIEATYVIPYNALVEVPDLDLDDVNLTVTLVLEWDGEMQDADPSDQSRQLSKYTN